MQRERAQRIRELRVLGEMTDHKEPTTQRPPTGWQLEVRAYFESLAPDPKGRVYQHPLYLTAKHFGISRELVRQILARTAKDDAS